MLGVPGHLVVRIPGFHCHGPGSIPGGGTEILQTAWHGQKKKKIKKNCSDAKAPLVIVLFVEHYKNFIHTAPKEQINATMLYAQLHLKKKEWLKHGFL